MIETVKGAKGRLRGMEDERGGVLCVEDSGIEGMIFVIMYGIFSSNGLVL